jgi:hypothetical protein
VFTLYYEITFLQSLPIRASNRLKFQKADIIFLGHFVLLGKSVSFRYRNALGSKAAVSNFEPEERFS